MKYYRTLTIAWLPYLMPLSSSGTGSDHIFLLKKVVPDLFPESFYKGRNHYAVAQLICKQAILSSKNLAR